MARTADETRHRLLRAATSEFAEHGIAGARTGRIARTAGVNEALLFRYFGSKDALFARVYEGLVAATVDDVPLDAADLPGYAGALFEYYVDHREVLRLSMWAALERPAISRQAVEASTAAKVEAVREAQSAGTVSSKLPADELLAMVVQLSLLGAEVSPNLAVEVPRPLRREHLVTAVAMLIGA